MPIYEFYCPQNNTLYQFLARTLAYRDAVPICPDGADLILQKRVSSFAVIGQAKEESDNDPFAGIDDAKMESLMADMEGDMSALDSDNPDPRQLGHFMRKMTDLMGDKVPPEVREVMRRLESGEDPEKLESEFGNLDESGGADALFSQVKKIVRGGRQPVRDPKLYDMRDWVQQIPQ
jgi:hypothetical protein